MGRPLSRLGVAALALASVTGAMSVVGGSAGASWSPITIAMISSLTGQGASQFSQSAVGFNARIAMQNAQGGVNGHQLTGIVIDDQTSPSGISTAVQDALSKGALGLVSTSPLFGGWTSGGRRFVQRAAERSMRWKLKRLSEKLSDWSPAAIAAALVS